MGDHERQPRRPGGAPALRALRATAALLFVTAATAAPLASTWRLSEYAWTLYLDGSASNRIFGGEKALPQGRYPFMALLTICQPGGGDCFRCGGSLISADTVLTAAHCIPSGFVDRIEVRLGYHFDDSPVTPGIGKLFRHRAVEVFPKYKHRNDQVNNPPTANKTGDLALVFLKERAPAALRPVPLDVYNTSNSPAYNFSITMGWGKTETSGDGVTNELMRVNLYPVEYKRCVELNRNVMDDEHICAMGRRGKEGYPIGDSCKGDSGGPLLLGVEPARIPSTFTYPNDAVTIYNLKCDGCVDRQSGDYSGGGFTGQLLGVVSYGPPDTSCGTTSGYGVYTRVSKYLDWIDAAIARNGGAERPRTPGMLPSFTSRKSFGLVQPAGEPPPARGTPPLTEAQLPVAPLAVWATQASASGGGALVLGNTQCGPVRVEDVEITVNGVAFEVKGTVEGQDQFTVCDAAMMLRNTLPPGCRALVPPGTLVPGAVVSVGGALETQDVAVMKTGSWTRFDGLEGGTNYTSKQWERSAWLGTKLQVGLSRC